MATGTSTPSLANLQYGYDGKGNRTSSTVGGTGTTATFDDANEMTAWATGQTVTYTYDADGNELTSSDGLAFSYNAKNQTTAITGLFGAPLTTIGYADAGQGERTKTMRGG